MNKYYLFLLIFVLLTGCSLYHLKPVYTSPLLTLQNRPIQALAQLLQACNIHHNNTLDSIVEQTQKQWLRPVGVERFQMSDTHGNQKAVLWPLFKEIGLVNAVAPTKTTYSYALVHGASLLGIRARLAYLINLWQSGIHFEKIVFLTGERFLDPKEESLDKLTYRSNGILPIRPDWIFDQKNIPKTEYDMVKMVYDQALIPEELKKIPVYFINAPQQQKPDGSWRRPNTEDTVHTWLDTHPEPGTCLAISNQPYVGYQDSIIKTLLPDWEIQTVGFAVPAAYESVSICLDSLARWLYQERIRLAHAQK